MPIVCLIVDDSVITRVLIRRCIQLSGIPDSGILEAGNGREALALLAKNKVGLVLADLHMPEMSGTELIVKIKSDAGLKSIPVIIISAEPSAERINHLLDLGASGYLQKPFTPEQFRKMLNSVLEKIHASA